MNVSVSPVALAKWSLALILTVIITLPAFAASLEQIKEKGVLEVAVYKDFPPYSYVEKGVQSGIDIDIAKALATSLSVSASIRLVGADENVEDDLRNNIWKGHYLGGGTADVMLHMPHDRQFSKMVDQVAFIAPYQIEQLIFAIDKNKLGDQPTLTNFMHEPIGVELDTLSDFYLLRAMGGKISEKVKHYKNLTEAINALKSGEVAGVMGPRGEIEGILATDKPDHIMMQSLVTPGLSRTAWAMGLAVKKQNTALVDAVKQAMSGMINDGTIEKIFGKYGVTWNPPATTPHQQ